MTKSDRERLEDLQKKAEKLKEKIETQEKRGQDEAEKTIGKMVIELTALDWKQINFERLKEFLSGIGESNEVYYAKEVDAAPALRRIRKWKKSGVWSDTPSANRRTKNPSQQENPYK